MGLRGWVLKGYVREREREESERACERVCEGYILVSTREGVTYLLTKEQGHSY